jgi:WD40 repeat protein
VPAHNAPRSSRPPVRGRHQPSAALAAARLSRDVRVPDLGTRVDDVAFSPDGRMLATAARDGRARIIDTASGKILAVLRGSDKTVYKVVFASNGNVLTAGKDGLIREWSVRGQLLRVIANLGDTVLGLDINATGDLLAAAVEDQVILLSHDGRHRTVLAGHVSLVSTVEFDRRADMLISGGLDGTVRAWDVHTGDAAAVFMCPAAASWRSMSTGANSAWSRQHREAPPT